MNEEEFEIISEKSAKGVRVTVRGHVGLVYTDMLQKVMNEAIQEKPAEITVNMQDVVYLSSVGLKIILKAYKDCQKAGSVLGIEMPSENVLNILKMTALDGLLII